MAMIQVNIKTSINFILKIQKQTRMEVVNRRDLYEYRKSIANNKR